MLKILHIAPMNYAGVPYSFYEMHKACGDFTRLITMHQNPSGFPEDICLNWNLPNFKFAKLWRKRKVNDRQKEVIKTAPFFKSKNIFEQIYFSLNDFLKEKKVDEIIEKYNLNDFDIIQYDAGLDFFRNSKQALKWKKQGKKIICCYYGSDLRTRGIIKELDEISDLNITSEFDHLALKKDLHYTFYPYDTSELPEKNNEKYDKIRIVHSPTNRKFKGTDLILKVINKIKTKKNIEFLLLENLPREEVLKIKSESDISIDQVGGSMGGTGYGKAGIETLGMGIPTITNFTKEYEEWIPENPFIVANNEDQLYAKLIGLIDSRDLRVELGEKGKKWVEKYHGFESVNSRLLELFKTHNII